MTPALALDGVSFAYGAEPALDAVSLTAPAGRVTALLGVNGAGKTTLINLVTRLFDAKAGRIAVCGHDVAQTPSAALARLGVVFQSRALDPTMSVAQNMVFHGALHGMGPREASERGAAALARVGMAEKAKARIAALSGGQQRRVEIARALLHEPALLVCDEATVGLDIEARGAIVRDVHALAAERGVGVLWATHLVDEIDPEDGVVVLHRGRVLARGSAREIAGGASLSDAFLSLTREAA